MNHHGITLKTRRKPALGRPIKLSFKKILSVDIVPGDHRLSIIIGEMNDQISHGKDKNREKVHADQILRVLERVSTDNVFANELLYYHGDALNRYTLSQQEKAAILSGDIKWIQKKVGELNDSQREWFDRRLAAEIW